jgi:hypothetical protein
MGLYMLRSGVSTVRAVLMALVWVTALALLPGDVISVGGLVGESAARMVVGLAGVVLIGLIVLDPAKVRHALGRGDLPVELSLEPSLAQAQFATSHQCRVQLLSVLVQNENDRGPTARGVVPTIEARPQESGDESRPGYVREMLSKRVVRGHGRWLNDSFGSVPVGSASSQRDSRAERRRDFPPTGERERLGLILRYLGENGAAYVLDSPNPDDDSSRSLSRGRWELVVILRGEPPVNPTRTHFDLANFDEGVVLQLVERRRRFLVGPKRTRVIASTAARFPKESRGRRLVRRLRGQAP